MNIAYLSTGSNMGDRLDNCLKGIEALERLGTVRVERVSGFYLTEPMYYPEQPWFVNAALRIRTGLDPYVLLKSLKALERQAGRENSPVRFGPRVLDFDIIFYNDWMVRSPELVIPHPRMHQRVFVLRPLVDIAPDLVHPVLQKTMAQLIEGLKEDGSRCIRMEERFGAAISTI